MKIIFYIYASLLALFALVYYFRVWLPVKRERKNNISKDYQKQIRLKCWDDINEKMIYEGDETIFSYRNGKWKVMFTQEINKVVDGIEMDVPVWREVENPIVSYE